MKKIILFFGVLALATAVHAAKCEYCRITMPLSEVGGKFYCKKHYCSKHKEILSPYMQKECKRCSLERLAKLGKGQCELCFQTKGLHVAKNDGSQWALYCVEHFCTKHNRSFVKPRVRGEAYCPQCSRDELQQRQMAARTERENIEKINAERRTEALGGIFGMNFGTAHVGPSPFTFNPKKKFRNFIAYSAWTRNEKVYSVVAYEIVETLVDLKKEYGVVIDLLDRKYDSGRRSEIKRQGLYRFSCTYRFGAHKADFSDAKQFVTVDSDMVSPHEGPILVDAEGDPVGAVRFRIRITAGLVDETKASADEEAEKELDAL